MNYVRKKEKNEKAYKGAFYISISPEFHKRIGIYALEHDITLNRFVEQSAEKQMASAY